MPRKTVADLDTRERLLRAGLALARKQGLKSLTVRAVADAAQANLGSFVYHFGSRDAYLDELIERWYAPLFERLQVEADEPGDALVHLRTAVLQLVDWLIEHRAFVAQLMLDAGSGEKAAQRFMRTLDQRHPAVLLRLVLRAQDSGHLRREPPLHVLLFLMSALAVPVLVFHLLGRSGWAPAAFVREVAAYTTEAAQVQSRLDWALRGLAP